VGKEWWRTKGTAAFEWTDTSHCGRTLCEMWAWDCRILYSTNEIGRWRTNCLLRVYAMQAYVVHQQLDWVFSAEASGGGSGDGGWCLLCIGFVLLSLWNVCFVLGYGCSFLFFAITRTKHYTSLLLSAFPPCCGSTPLALLPWSLKRRFWHTDGSTLSIADWCILNIFRSWRNRPGLRQSVESGSVDLM